MEKVILKEGETLRGARLAGQVYVQGRNVTIEDCTVECDGVALYSNYNCSGLKVVNSTFASRGNNAVKIVADKLASPIEGINFMACRFEFARMGVELQNHGNNDYKFVGAYVEDCKFEAIDDSKDYRYGLSLSGYGREVTVNGCTFDKCVKCVELVGFSDVTIFGSDLKGTSNSVISSNSRRMKDIHISDCSLVGMPHLYNCEDSWIADCEISCSYVEVKKSRNVEVSGNNITSYVHYSVMLNQAHNCHVHDNTIRQNGANWSVIRCYGQQSYENLIEGNKMSRAKKTGKLYDQIEGAHDNIFKP